MLSLAKLISQNSTGFHDLILCRNVQSCGIQSGASSWFENILVHWITSPVSILIKLHIGNYNFMLCYG